MKLFIAEIKEEIEDYLEHVLGSSTYPHADILTDTIEKIIPDIPDCSNCPLIERGE